MLVGLKHLPSLFQRLLFVACLALAACMTLTPRALAQDLSKPCLLVATDKLQDRYVQTVILASPYGEGHVGVVLNRPGDVHLADLFPDHPPSRAVTEPVYWGGGMAQNMVVALVRAKESPGPRSIEMIAGVWLVTQGTAIDNIIETAPASARYYMGFTVWPSGLLAQHVAAGLLAVRPLDPGKLFQPDTSRLWQELAPTRGRRQET